MAELPQRSPRRKKKGIATRLRHAITGLLLFCLVSLTWLSQIALPSSSHASDTDTALAARLDSFTGRNLSMNSSQDAKQNSEKDGEDLGEKPTTTNAADEEPAKNTDEANQTIETTDPNTLSEAVKEEAERKAEIKETLTNPKNLSLTKPEVTDPSIRSEAGKAEAERKAEIKNQFTNPQNINKNGRFNVAGTSRNTKYGKVQFLVSNKCKNKSRKGQFVAITYAAHRETANGLIYALSGRTPEKILLGRNQLIRSLDENLVDACPGDRRLITMPYSQTVDDRKTEKRFKLSKNTILVVWNVVIQSVGSEEQPYEEEDDDDYKNFVLDNDADADDDPSPVESAADKWKKALGLVETVEKEVEVEEEREVATNATEETNATHATIASNTTNATIASDTTNATTIIKVKTKKKTMVEQPIAVLKTPSVATMVPFHPAVPYLGVLVDGGRHYFPLTWLKKLVDDLHMLRFNFIHLRLTDDQAFNVRLKSHPELALPAPATAEDTQKENPVWTTDELRDLVEYAAEKNITIMPEINAPGHCGSWSGVEGLVVPCPKFACEKGYGVPLNETSPKLLGVLKDVIKEVSEIFHTSPYIHLGGDEVHMSSACYQEIGQVMPKYNDFEAGLKRVLKELRMPEDKVVRWETTGQQGINVRAGDMVHWWQTFPRNKRRDGEFFVSQGLYFDSCGERAAPEFFSHTQKLVGEDPKGIIAGTFELSTNWWKDRNVYGRLLVVAMGASKEGQSLQWSSEMYVHFCRSLGWSDETCLADGKPLMFTNKWLEKWKSHWITWKAATCDRLTEPYDVRLMKDLKIDEKGEPVVNSQKEVALSVEPFWESFGEVPSGPRVSSTNTTKLLFHRVVPHLGVTWDISVVNDLKNVERMVNVLSRLGYNLIHLRLLDDFSFPLTLESHPRIAWNGNVTEQTPRRRTWAPLLTLSKENVTNVSQVEELVKVAAAKGIKVMPELSVVSRAGGWFSSGLVANCPNVMCDTDYGIPLDITYPAILSMVFNVVFELRKIFSSEYFHLGYDERTESAACFDEIKLSADFDLFEEKLMKTMQLVGIPPHHVLRWESSDSVEKSFRAGNITHYRSKLEPTSIEKNPPSFLPSWLGGTEVEPFFVSTGLGNSEADNDPNADAWTIYRHTRRLVQSSPTGIIAQYLLSKDKTTIGTSTDMGKLIAVAIGASGLPKMNRGKFREVYMKACSEELNQSHCSKFAKDDLSSSATADQRVLRSNCETLTYQETRRKMKPGI